MSITAYLELERDEILDAVLLAMADSDAGRKPRPLRSKLPKLSEKLSQKINERPGRILSRTGDQLPASGHLAPDRPSFSQGVQRPVSRQATEQTDPYTDNATPVLTPNTADSDATATADTMPVTAQRAGGNQPTNSPGPAVDSPPRERVRQTSRRKLSRSPRRLTRWRTVLINSAIVAGCLAIVWTTLR